MSSNNIPLWHGTHSERRAAIRAQHGEIMHQIERPETVTALYAIGYTTVLTFLALFVSWNGWPWWASLMLAYSVGAVIAHALGVAIHDFGHNLVFKNRSLNMLGVCVADLCHIVPYGVPFVYFHRKHHAYINDVFYDPDVPSEWEDRLFGRSSIGKVLWMLFNPIIQSVRVTQRYGGVSVIQPRSWLIVNVVLNVLYAATLYFVAGWSAIVFCASSSYFAASLHPTAARWIAEHYRIVPAQETYSYYGPLNNILLNIGYHNEHHDFPTVSCLHLPTLRAHASEFYNPLYVHRSYMGVLWEFISNPLYRLDGRNRTMHDRIGDKETYGEEDDKEGEEDEIKKEQ